MAKYHHRLRLSVVILSSSLLLCCVIPAIGFDPLFNALFGITARPVIPEYPAGQGTQRRVERNGLHTHRITTFRTTDAQTAVITFYGRNLGPPNGKWRQTDLAHTSYNRGSARTWVYDDHCPGTQLDLTFTPVVIGERLVSDLTDVEAKATQWSCRDRWLVVIVANLCPPCSRYLPK
jgi:hypothetical protein